jgi:hypothetical protein
MIISLSDSDFFIKLFFFNIFALYDNAEYDNRLMINKAKKLEMIYLLR